MTTSEKWLDGLNLPAHAAALIHRPANLFYLTEGYSGEGVLFLSAARRVIVTDFRYMEQAERQAPGFERVMSSREHTEDRCIADLCESGGSTEIRYESDWLSVDRFEELRLALGEDTVFLPLRNAVQKMREIKTPAELSAMRKAGAVTAEAFEAVLPKIHAGMTERELKMELEGCLYRLGADALAFDTIIASGENGSLCHAVPGKRRLQKGDMITMDFGARVGGYCSDMTRTVALGEPSPEMRKVYSTVLRAQEMCEKALVPGKTCSEIDRLARSYIDSQGYAGRFGHGLGHCVGIEIHENPRLSQTCHDKLQAGMVITVEPGIYLPGLGGVRIENTCLIQENGSVSLTAARKELIVL